MKKIAKPAYTEHAVYYETFINLVDEHTSVLDQLKQQAKLLDTLLLSLTEKQLVSSYAVGKWSVKEVLQHLMDIERVLMYRALCFSRFDKEPKYFFDENKFIANSIVQKIKIKSLLKEYKTQRANTIAFFQNQTTTTLKRTGIASNTPMSVRACAWILCGHEKHHIQILKDKYSIA
jgi:hypothetical protein